MKIAIFTDTFLPHMDGVVVVVENLALNLAKRGHKVIIVAPRYGKKEVFSHPNIKVVRINSLSLPTYPEYKFTLFLNGRIFNMLRKEKIDVIHSNTPFTVGMLGLILSKTLKIPMVGTFHTFNADPNYLKHVKLNYKGVERAGWAYTRFYFNNCDIITCPSPSTKKELISHKFKSPIKVISNGIDLDLFGKVKNNRSKDNENLLFVGRVCHEKNISLLVEAFDIVIKSHPKAKLTIVGDGPQMQELKDFIKLRGLSKNILLKGKIEHKKLINSSIYRSSNIFVTASVTENQPITILEAQANGLVCVGPNVRGIPDLVKHNFNGILINPQDKEDLAKKMINLLSNKKSIIKMRANTLKEIKKHHLPKIIDTWENVYKELIC